MKEIKEEGVNVEDIKEDLEVFDKIHRMSNDIDDWIIKDKEDGFHPALDFKNSRAYIGVWLPKRIENKGKMSIEERFAVITSDHIIFELQKEDNPLVYPGKLRNRWSTYSIKRYLNKIPSLVDFPSIFNEIKAILKYYMDLQDENDYNLIALWIIGTYFHPMFNSYPYLFFNAVKRSGKTKLMTIISLLAFNARLNLDPTSATTFRLVNDNRCTLLFDEAETITSKDKKALRLLLNSGYKQGGTVARAQEGRRTGAFYVKEYNMYGPKCIANISGIEDVLEDRCITLIMKRTRNRIIANREIDLADPKWQEIRDKLYLLVLEHFETLKFFYQNLNVLFSSVVSEISDFKVTEPESAKSKGSSVVSVVSVVKKKDNTNNESVIYLPNKLHQEIETTPETTLTTLNNVSNMYTNINNIDTNNNKSSDNIYNSVYVSPPTLHFTNYTKEKKSSDNDKKSSDNDKNLNFLWRFTARDVELWKPILALAKCVDESLFDGFFEYIDKKIKEKVVEDTTESIDLNLVRILFIMFRDGIDYYKIKDITEKLKNNGEYDFLNTRKVGRAMRRLGFSDKRRVGSGVEYKLSMDKIMDIATRLNLDIEELEIERASEREKYPEGIPTSKNPFGGYEK